MNCYSSLDVEDCGSFPSKRLWIIARMRTYAVGTSWHMHGRVFQFIKTPRLRTKFSTETLVSVRAVVSNVVSTTAFFFDPNEIARQQVY